MEVGIDEEMHCLTRSWMYDSCHSLLPVKLIFERGIICWGLLA